MANRTPTGLRAKDYAEAKSQFEQTIYADKGCITCPFMSDLRCNIDNRVTVTHDYTYPCSCPLLKTGKIVVLRLKKEIEVLDANKTD